MNYTQNVYFAPKDALATGQAAKRIKGSEMDAELLEISNSIASKEDSANKGQASGYCGLDSGSKVATTNLPQSTTSAIGAVELATNVETETGTDTARAVTPAGLEYWAVQNAGIVKQLSDLANPGGDYLIFWDQSAGSAAFLTLGTNLSTTGTTLNAAYTTNASLLTSGTLPDGRIAVTGVTQYQASLSIGWSQLTSVPSTFTPSSHTHGVSDLTATGTPSATTVLCGDNTWKEAASVVHTTFSGAAAHAAIAATMTSGSWTQVTFGTEDYDTDSAFASSTYTAPATGKYMITVNAQWDANSAGQRGLRVKKNTTVVATNMVNAVADTAIGVTWIGALTAGDTLKAEGYTANSSGNRDINAGSDSNISIVRLA